MNIETERLILRAWQKSDALWLYEYAKDPAVGPAAGWPVHTSVQNSEEIIENVLSAPETYAVVLKSEGHIIGSVGLKMGEQTDMTDRADEAEIGYWVGRPFWGQGIIPEAVRALENYAFTVLNLNKLWCGYYDGNEKSRRVQEKCGFSYHHTTEDLFLPLMNEYRTGHVSTLTKEDWQKKI